MSREELIKKLQSYIDKGGIHYIQFSYNEAEELLSYLNEKEWSMLEKADVD